MEQSHPEQGTVIQDYNEAPLVTGQTARASARPTPPGVQRALAAIARWGGSTATRAGPATGQEDNAVAEAHSASKMRRLHWLALPLTAPTAAAAPGQARQDTHSAISCSGYVHQPPPLDAAERAACREDGTFSHRLPSVSTASTTGQACKRKQHVTLASSKSSGDFMSAGIERASASSRRRSV